MRRLLVLTAGLLAILHSRAADYAQAGALNRNGTSEISIVYDASVSRESASAIANYTFADTNIGILGIRYVPLDNSVVLTVPSLSTNSSSVTVSNIQTTAGATLPAATLSFRPTGASWAAVGGQELGFTPDAVAVGANGFDLISGGIQMRDTYDESTFVYEAITGDFDKQVRVPLQEPSSERARAGLMARETLDEAKPRPNDPFDPAQAFSRYIQVDVNPTKDAANGPGQNRYEVNVRFYTGGIGSPDFDVTETFTNNTAVPNYPNAWVRLKRVGQTFYTFRSDTGTNWVSLGAYTFPTTDADGNPVPAFSATAFVGPNFSPETGNISDSANARRAFLAQFRDYGNGIGTVPVEPPGDVKITIARVQNQVELTWSGGGTLQTSTNLAGAGWANLSGTSPVRVAADKKAQFFRVKVQ